nr:uncharacterized protein LOC109185000 isoform X2 [Ipomoea batatas]GMD61947.1 uncharacterized protein LOC109185000 isoform X2 [Ipomoea batatas]
MSLDNEDPSLPEESSSIHSDKHSKISYTREFLLSLSELEICKKLPSGIEPALLSELESTPYDIPDRQRSSVAAPPLQGFRRNDYGSSPPTRGIYGRWENRFSVRSDQESDTQSARDSESVRRHGNQPRRSWQTPEHDGLLGSGSFPRPSVYASGIPAAKARGNDHYQLSKSNEPYHPPRPYKAGPQSRRDASDSYNNETFGSVECTSEDRVEEERRRRASFELMRKEQHKASLQKKQYLNLDKPESECVSDSDMSALADDVKEKSRLLDRRKELDVSTTLPDTDNDSGKSSFPSQTSASRPLVPPGFRSTLLEKDSGLKAVIQLPLKQAGKPESEENLLHSGMDNPVQNGFFDGLERQSSQSSQELCLSDQQLDDRSIHLPFLKKGNQIDASNKKPCLDDNLNPPSSILETQKLMEGPEVIELSAGLSQEKIQMEPDLNQSTSILDQIFGSAISMTVGESEHQDTKRDDKWSPRTNQSSKFAHWFCEEEETKAKDNSLSRPNDLLALIAGGDNSRSQAHDVKSTENILSNALAATVEVSEPLYASSKDTASPTILTCEDLEQTILSEYNENGPNLQSLLPGWSTNSKPEEQRERVDDRASQHLLSLLQKGPDLGNKIHMSNMDTDSVDSHEKFTEDNKPMEDESALGKAITLETLFGTAFMNELQSMQAPVSIQRGGSVASVQSDGLESQRSLPVPNDVFFPSTIDGVGGSKMMSNDNVMVDREQTKLDKAERWLGFDDPLTKLHPNHLTDRSYKNGDFDGVIGFQLPEDDNLFSGGNPVNPQVSLNMADGNLNKGVVEQLASVHAAPSNQRTMVGPGGLSFLHGLRDQVEPEMFHNLPAQPSSSLFHPMQMNQGRQLVHPFETLPAHSTSQMKFVGPEIMTHIDTPNHQFSGNMMHPPFHRPNPAVSGFDLPTQHPMMQQQMQMPGNYPHMQHDRLRNAPFPQHPGNQPAAAFLQEPNPMQVLPFGPRPPRQPNINGFGIPMPVDINRGSNQPEAIQKLLEMEVRAKQMHPFAAGNSQGMYGHELDMGLRYR